MHELIAQIIFYVVAVITVISAFMVVTQNNPVRCVLSLVLTFISSSMLWMMLSAEFLALILVLVYVGAVMTLFLFVVMMLNIDQESQRTHYLRYVPFGLIIVAFLVGLMLVAVPESWYKNSTEKLSNVVTVVDYINEDEEDSSSAIPGSSNTEEIGLALYKDYVLPLELAAVLLLVAIIAAITLAHRSGQRSKKQDVVKQMMTRKEDRIVLLNMPSENNN